MALDTTTGNPPAVTHDQIEAWTKLADDVTAALSMGGEQGLDFLINIMSEWCDAVDDVNTARQICLDLADRGLRHEALEWHAEGFFEIADRLDPDRPGWDAWAATLKSRNIVTPRMDADLKEMANRIHEDLYAQDLSGQSLSDYLVQLRRNMLLRGHLGERLVILESIRGIDPTPEAWPKMISPIRRKRVDMIADEVRSALGRRDFPGLAALREEVASHDWGDDLPGTVSALLNATSHFEAMGEYRGRLSQGAASIVRHVDDGKRQPFGSPGYVTAVQAARAARQEYREVRTALTQAVRDAAAVSEVAALVSESGVRQALHQIDTAVSEPFRWLDQQAEVARVREIIGKIEATVLRQVETAPEKTSDREGMQAAVKRWKRQADDTLEKCRQEAAKLPGGVPQTTQALFQQVGQANRDLEAHLKKLKARETVLVLGVVGGVGLVIVGIVVFIAIVIVTA